LTRSEATDDARSSLVGLTPAGTALIDRAIEIHARTVHEALTGKITAVEQAELLKVLSRITV
jgi:DNA-binding MarR family transcriptional regulator